jgi:hypothetical protein
VASQLRYKFYRDGDGEPQPATAARRDLKMVISNAANFAASCTWTRMHEVRRKAVPLPGWNGPTCTCSTGAPKPRDRVAANCSSCAMSPQGEATARGCRCQHKRRLLAVGPLYRRVADARLVDSSQASGRSSRKGNFWWTRPFRLGGGASTGRAHNQLS